MKISKLGEFGLIEKVIAPEFRELVNKRVISRDIAKEKARIPEDF